MSILSSVNKRYYLIICLAIAISSCQSLKMITHTDKSGDTYCVYKISNVKKTGNTQPLKKGDIICLYCPGEFHCVLARKRWIKVYTGDYVKGQISTVKDVGISYLLDQDDVNATCTNCPNDHKFELF